MYLIGGTCMWNMKAASRTFTNYRLKTSKSTKWNNSKAINAELQTLVTPMPLIERNTHMKYASLIMKGFWNYRQKRLSQTRMKYCQAIHSPPPELLLEFLLPPCYIQNENNSKIVLVRDLLHNISLYDALAICEVSNELIRWFKRYHSYKYWQARGITP